MTARWSGSWLAAVLVSMLPLATSTLAPTPTPTSACGSLQALVDAAPAGSVVTAPACTYRETVTIGKSLTLRGYGATISGKDAAGSTVRSTWVVVNASDVTVEGFTMRDANNAPQTGAVRVRAGISRFTLRACDLAYAAGADVSIGVANSSLIANCAIHNAGQLGVHVGGDGTNGRDNVVRDNRIYANNTAGFDPGWEAGGLKATRQTGLRLEGNDVYDNAGPGLWCDISCRGTVYRANRVHGNASAGIFEEISSGALITNNVVWNNGWGFTSWGWGGGIVVSSSSGAEVANNVVAWNADGIDVISQNRGDPGWNSVTGVYVHDNTIVLAPRAGDSSDKIALGWLQDWAGVMFDSSSANRGASNAYWIGSAEPEWARFGWNGHIDTLAAFNATPGEEGGRYLTIAERNQVLGTAGIAP
jgi:hypothetical protein